MGSIDTPRRWEGWVDEELTEKRPSRLDMTDSERIEWLSEYCEKFEYVDSHYTVIDLLGQKTVDLDFKEAVDLAAARFYAANQ